jgi:CRP/FNR family transcriptional regulator
MSVNTAAKEEFIKVFHHFRTSPESLINDILAASLYKEFTESSIIYSDGDECPGIALFLSGEVRGESGREITLYEIFPGETCILNASCILSHRNYPANAVTLTNGAMLFLPAQAFQILIANYEDMRTFVFSLFSQRFSAMMELIEEITFARWTSDYMIIWSKRRRMTASTQLTSRSPMTLAHPGK